MAKILLVEDDLDLGERIVQWLKHEHRTVEMISDGLQASDYLAQLKFDLIVLDWGKTQMPAQFTKFASPK